MGNGHLSCIEGLLSVRLWNFLFRKWQIIFSFCKLKEILCQIFSTLAVLLGQSCVKAWKYALLSSSRHCHQVMIMDNERMLTAQPASNRLATFIPHSIPSLFPPSKVQVCNSNQFWNDAAEVWTNWWSFWWLLCGLTKSNSKQEITVNIIPA